MGFPKRRPPVALCEIFPKQIFMKGKKCDLKNDRGIFLVTVFWSVLMILIYNNLLDETMSDSQVGVEKGKVREITYGY